MGYSVDYLGRFDLNKPLTDELNKFLFDFSKTRHMKRKFKKSAGYGIEGEFYLCPNEETDKHQDSIIDYNTPPKTQPNVWCKWVPTFDKKGIHWSGAEKFYNGPDWLIYIIKNFLEPQGYILNGVVKVIDWECNEFEDEFSYLVVDNNELYIGPMEVS